MKRIERIGVGLSVFLFANLARATVTEPNGLVVPRDSMNGEVQLYTLFQQLGEPIDWKADAHDSPATFSPLCGFEAQFLLHEAGSSLGVAWYNATGSAPPNADLHVVVPAGSPVGTKVTSADIASDPNYKGGAVGFALVGGQTHYTEKQWNPVCSGCSNPGPWIMAVIYQSKLFPNTYYVAFEDGPVDANSYGNDGDYNDYVFGFTGITCAGGGQVCDTGKQGICAAGVTQCSTAGTSNCQQLSQPMPETCNAVDDDCNGMVDDGKALCPGSEICFHGKCVPPCGSGEFQCPTGLVCMNGVCIDPKCTGVMCPAGQVCHGGTCKGACDDVVCPLGQSCVDGACVDYCAGKTCPMGQVCEQGACIAACGCNPCPSGKACDPSSGMCVEPSCVGVMCSGGQQCGGGTCQDPCAGAKCPAGQACMAGNCVDVPGSGGGAGAAGAPMFGTGGSSHAGAGAAGKAGATPGGKGGAAGATSKGGSGGPTQVGPNDTADDGSQSSGGCGCRTARGPSFGWLAAFLAVGAVAARRAGSRSRRR